MPGFDIVGLGTRTFATLADCTKAKEQLTRPLTYEDSHNGFH